MTHLTNEDLGERTDPPLIIGVGLLAMFLLLVIVMPRILQWAAVPMKEGFSERQVLITASIMKKTERGVIRFYRDHGRYPTEFEGLNLVRKTEPKDAELGPYLGMDIPQRDQWMRYLHYRAPAEDGIHPFVIESLGHDGKPGGEGPDRDFNNWEWPTTGEIPGRVAPAEE